MNLEKEFVPYEEALALKELGFDEECFGEYTSKGFLCVEVLEGEGCFNHNKNKPSMYGKYCTAPLYQQAFRWFRENFLLQHRIDPVEIGYKSIKIFSIDTETKPIEQLYSDPDELIASYEKAELACVRKLIKIVKAEAESNKNEDDE